MTDSKPQSVEDEYHWIQQMSRVRRLLREAQGAYGHDDIQKAKNALAEADGALETIRQDAFGGEQSEQSLEGSNAPVNVEKAVYECRCGNQEAYMLDEWSHLRWVRRRLGLTNLGETVAYLTDCCDRPSYMEVS